MRLVSLDPGGTTGIALAVGSPGETWEIETRSLSGEHHYDLYALLWDLNPDILIWEQFVYQRRDLAKGVSLRLDSREYIGIAKLYVQQYCVGGVKGFESPLAFKAFWDDRKLERLGFLKGKNPHERDALRHLLHYIQAELKDNQFIVKAR